MFFASDNTSPVHPNVMNALVKANEGYQPSYGNDTMMDAVRTRIREVFEAPEAAVYLVATGSTANALSLATFCPPWGAIYCHRSSHIEVDECGAPEFYTGGAKLVLIDGDNAKMTPESLRRAVSATPQGDVHAVQRGMVSITNVSELGGVYSVAEITELAAIAKEYNLPCQLDGARFSNAIVATNASPAEMTWKAGIDVLSFGGTKNGLMGVEAVVIFEPAKAWEFELRRKRGGHLFSKHRYLSAQFQAYLEDDLWLDMARHANAMGARLSAGLAAMPDATVLNPTDANMVFASLPCSTHKAAFAGGAQYSLSPFDQTLDGPEDEALPSRLVCSWSTTEADVDQFLSLITR